LWICSSLGNFAAGSGGAWAVTGVEWGSNRNVASVHCPQLLPTHCPVALCPVCPRRAAGAGGGGAGGAEEAPRDSGRRRPLLSCQGGIYCIAQGAAHQQALSTSGRRLNGWRRAWR
jgi:hypothetical protein